MGHGYQLWLPVMVFFSKKRWSLLAVEIQHGGGKFFTKFASEVVLDTEDLNFVHLKLWWKEHYQILK